LEDCCTELRREIARLARRKDRRFVPRSRKMPCRWHPTTVNNPEVGIPFTDITAWHFIAKLAENGCELEEIVLEQPSGEKAYIISVLLEANMPDLYIKIQLKNANIFGRSFHYSTE
jgi:hypothetical protein